MISPSKVGRRPDARVPTPRVGLVGLFGQGNLGNDGSLEAILGYLRAEHPDAILDVMCTRPDHVASRYAVPASRLRWYDPQSRPRRGVVTLVMKRLKLSLGVAVDAVRITSWVRRHDAVIVPGMGVLEATLPVRPWQTPYWMFLLCTSGRLFGTKVALVSVGANVIQQRATRLLITAAARRASYRSFRDSSARDAMRQMGLETSSDPVYPDLAFCLPAPAVGKREPAGAVGVGVMEYSGSNDDRQRADEIRASYIEKMTCFIAWLIDNGRRVRLFAGDTIDNHVVHHILADLDARRPGLGPERIVAEHASSLGELMEQMASVDVVVASRYHTVLCALKLAKPTLSVGYGAKFDALMRDMGLSEFAQSAKALDVDYLIDQFTALEDRSAQVRQMLLERSAVNTRLLERQFSELSALLFPQASSHILQSVPRSPTTGHTE